MNTAVVLIIFNRPDLTAQVLHAIAKSRPRLLLVIADGPRPYKPNESEKCRASRELLKTIDWPCEVRTNFSFGNMGCRRRVVTGLDWVFGQVEEAIILEDDCLPHPCFFSYCEDLLTRYREDPRIMHISGNNFQPAGWKCRHSYYFSKYVHAWGWATWRRAWSLYDENTVRWPALRDAGWLSSICPDIYEAAMWKRYFDNIHAHRVDTWDTQWIFTCWLQGALSIVPAVNLVTNIGFRSDATHTTRETGIANRPACDIGPLQHPPAISPSLLEDRSDFLNVHNGRSFTRRNRLHRRLARFPTRFIKRLFVDFDLWR
jgi:hypothetical protein